MLPARSLDERDTLADIGWGSLMLGCILVGGADEDTVEPVRRIREMVGVAMIGVGAGLMVARALTGCSGCGPDDGPEPGRAVLVVSPAPSSPSLPDDARRIIAEARGAAA